MLDIQDLFSRYRDDVYRLAISYTRSQADAEDVCQSVFLKLMEQKNFRPGKEKQWLLRVTANECKNLLRSHWWKTTVSMEETLCIDPPEFNETLHCILSLPPKYRVVIYLHYYEGMTAKEICHLLHISPSAVTTRLSRARTMLKPQLEEVSL